MDDAATSVLTRVGQVPTNNKSTKIIERNDEESEPAEQVPDKVISEWELYFDPLLSTSQERWFINNCLKKRWDRHVIVSAFRGCGKTTTLERLRRRGRFLVFYRKLEFYDAKNLQDLEKQNKVPSLYEDLLSMLWHLVLAAAVGMMLQIIWNYVCKRLGKKDSKQSDEAQDPHLEKQTIQVLIDNIPSLKEIAVAGITTILLTTLSLLSRFRRRVIVLDDVTKTVQMSKDVPSELHRHSAVRDLLERLSKKEKVANVIFVSSNEALDKLFEDPNKGTRGLLRMPPLTPEEMEARIERMGIRSEITVKDAIKSYGKELALSARFYQHMYVTSRMSPMRPTRDELRQLCSQLTLLASWKVALYGSHLVKLESYKEFSLGGCIDERLAKSENVVYYVTQAFPTRPSELCDGIPHRLIIPMILAATTHLSNLPPIDEKHIQQHLCKLLPEVTVSCEDFLEREALYDKVRSYCQKAAELASLQDKLQSFLNKSDIEIKELTRGLVPSLKKDHGRPATLEELEKQVIAARSHYEIEYFRSLLNTDQLKNNFDSNIQKIVHERGLTKGEVFRLSRKRIWVAMSEASKLKDDDSFDVIIEQFEEQMEKDRKSFEAEMKPKVEKSGDKK